jgi:hypothetical protein
MVFTRRGRTVRAREKFDMLQASRPYGNVKEPANDNVVMAGRKSVRWDDCYPLRGSAVPTFIFRRRS